MTELAFLGELKVKGGFQGDAKVEPIFGSSKNLSFSMKRYDDASFMRLMDLHTSTVCPRQQ